MPPATRLPLSARILSLYGVHIHHPGKWRVHEKLRKWFKIDVPGSFNVKRRGFHWILKPSDFVEADLFWLGEKDHWDSYHIRKLIRPGAVVFDVGANFGYYSIAVFSGCNVYAFEPFPPTRKRLMRNLELNGCANITVLPFGLSDSTVTTRMTVRDDNSGSARISKDPEGTEISVTTLDSFCKNQRITSIEFIKIDVEGHEEAVLRGGLDTIRSLRPKMMVELDPSQLEKSNCRVQSLMNTLTGLGYELRVAKKDRLIPLTEVPHQGDVINAFCLPQA